MDAKTAHAGNFIKSFIFPVDNIECRYYNDIHTRYFVEKENTVPREPFQTLSEPMYYILLALMDECCGIDIMQKVARISRSRVFVGPGTVYALLERFVKSGVIRETACEGRKRSYLITDYGKELLQEEYARAQLLFSDGKSILEDGI